MKFRQTGIKERPHGDITVSQGERQLSVWIALPLPNRPLQELSFRHLELISSFQNFVGMHDYCLSLPSPHPCSSALELCIVAVQAKINSLPLVTLTTWVLILPLLSVPNLVSEDTSFELLKSSSRFPLSLITTFK